MLFVKKCRFFWRLDEIFGARSNNEPVIAAADTESPQPHPQVPSHLQSRRPLEPLVLDTDESDQEQQEERQNPRASREVDEDVPGREDSANLNNGLNLLPSSQPETCTAVLSTSIRSKSKSGAARNGNNDGGLKRLLDLDRSDWVGREEKRLKMQGDLQLQITRMQTESQERLLEMLMRMQREERECQRERDERQLQMIQSVMASMTGIVNSAIGSNHKSNTST